MTKNAQNNLIDLNVAMIVSAQIEHFIGTVIRAQPPECQRPL